MRSAHIPEGTPVRVYRNLHRDCLSVQARVNGAWRVVAHRDSVNLSNVTFKVSEAGRQRALREGRKNVHAFVVGSYVSSAWDERAPDDTGTFISYNPRLAARFYKADGTLIDRAHVAVVGTRRSVAWGAR